MNRLKKWIRYVPDRIDDGLRYLCGRMSPDVRRTIANRASQADGTA